MRIGSSLPPEATANRRAAQDRTKASWRAVRCVLLAGMIVVAAASSAAWCEPSFAAALDGQPENTALPVPAVRGDATDAGSLAAAESGGVGGSLPGPALMTEIATWLAANFELPPSDDLPRVELASPARLVAIRLGGFAANRSETASQSNPPQAPVNIAGDLVAVYHSANRIIYLPEGWNGTGPAATSILVHEMVHHLQTVGGLKYPCPGAREKSAYLAQDRWLRRFGLDLEMAFGIDLFTVLVRSACFH